MPGSHVNILIILNSFRQVCITGYESMAPYLYSIILKLNIQESYLHNLSQYIGCSRMEVNILNILKMKNQFIEVAVLK